MSLFESFKLKQSRFFTENDSDIKQYPFECPNVWSLSAHEICLSKACPSQGRTTEDKLLFIYLSAVDTKTMSESVLSGWMDNISFVSTFTL